MQFITKERKQLTIAEIINVLLYSVIIVMPFIIAKAGEISYVIGKTYYLYIVGIMILSLMIKDMVKNKKNPIKKLNVHIKLSLVFLITILVSSIFSINRNTAFIGSVYRNEGFYMFCIYIILFIATILYFKINKDWVKNIIIVADVMCIYGIAQFWGISPIAKMLDININMGQSNGFIGNRNFFSTYILIFLFISVALYIFCGDKMNLILSIPLFGALLCTLTRGGWIAFIGFSVVGFVFILRRKDCLKRAFIIFIVFILILVCIDTLSNGKITGRANKSNIVNADGVFINSVGARSDILKMSFKAFKEKPFWGSGPDTLMERLQTDFKKDVENYSKLYNELPDKAHNEYLEYAVSCGIFTLISYLLLIGSIIIGLLKNINDDRAKIMLLCLIGYLVQAFFNISVIRVAPLYWIMLGVFVKYINSNEKSEIIEN